MTPSTISARQPQPLPQIWQERSSKFDQPAPGEQSFVDSLTGLMPRLRGFARRLAADTAHAEDLVQETMLKAWQARQSFSPGTNIQAWLFTILRNIHLSALRRRRWEGNWTEELEASLGHGERQSNSIELQQVLALIRCLPGDQRIALELVTIEQLSYEDAAGQIGVTLGTIKSRVARARAALLGLIEGGSPQTTGARRRRVTDSHPVVPETARSDASFAPKLSSALGRWRAAKAAGKPFLIGV